MAESNLTPTRLKALVSYDAETGQFLWISGQRKGCVAGGIDQSGYWKLTIDGRHYRSHRLAWLYVHGVHPAEHIDHLNGERADNRLANLRAVSSAVNSQNLRAAKSNSKTGLLGVHWSQRNKWVAKIGVNGRQVTIGTNYPSPEAAHAAYMQAKRVMHAGCTI